MWPFKKDRSEELLQKEINHLNWSRQLEIGIAQGNESKEINGLKNKYDDLIYSVTAWMEAYRDLGDREGYRRMARIEKYLYDRRERTESQIEEKCLLECQKINEHYDHKIQRAKAEKGHE